MQAVDRYMTDGKSLTFIFPYTIIGGVLFLFVHTGQYDKIHNGRYLVKRKFWAKYSKLIIYILILTGVVWLVWTVFGDSLPEYFRLLEAGDEAAIEAYINEEASWKGMLTIVILAALQVVSIVFPGFAIQIAAGVIYGWFRSFLLCYFGFLLGNMGVFLFVRRMGSQIAGFAPQRNKGRWLRQRLSTTRPEFVVAFVNMLPVLPNGIIPYIAAGSSISVPGYLGAIAVGCWFQILLNCIAGGFIKNGDYLFMVLAIGVQLLIIAIAAWKRKEIMALIPGGTEFEEDEPDEKARPEEKSEHSKDRQQKQET